MSTVKNANGPIYRIHAESRLKSFIENSYNVFCQKQSDLRLKHLIHLLILARHTDHWQVRVLLLANFLEVTRYDFADMVGILNKSFNAIWEAFCKHYSLHGWTNRFTKIRNDIVHEGRLKSNRPLYHCLKLQHFCERVILGLLDWHGSYIPIENPWRMTSSGNVAESAPSEKQFNK